MEGMFHRINDFAYPRNEKQAVGFGLFHLLVVTLGGMLAFLVFGLLFGQEALGQENAGTLRSGVMMLSVGYTGWLACRLLAAKGRMADLRSVALGVFAVVLATQGALLGMMVVAALSILQPKPAVTALQGKDE